MTPEEIQKRLIEISGQSMFPTSDTSFFFHGEWKQLPGGTRICQIGTVFGAPIITMAIALPGESDLAAIESAIERIKQHYGPQEENKE